MGVYDCKIVNKYDLAKDQFVLELFSKEIAGECKAGQFVNVECRDALLRRPISISSVDRENGIFKIAIRVKGSGTAYLASCQIGDSLSVIGPLGHGFDLTNVKSCVVVGGGIGIYPLLFLLTEAKKLGIPTTTVCGFRSKADSFCLDEINELSDHVVYASECGDMEVCGNAIDALNTLDLTGSVLFTCGPNVMMKKVAEIAEKQTIPCQVSLEQRMGCGTGICLVCACKTKKDHDFEYKRCCKDGPVFDAREVIWE